VPSDLELVTVLELRDAVALSLARGALDDAGVPYILIEQGPRFPTGIWGSPGVASELRSSWSTLVQVPKEFEAHASELLEPLRNPEP
jgi:hypothetical protein